MKGKKMLAAWVSPEFHRSWLDFCSRLTSGGLRVPSQTAIRAACQLLMDDTMTRQKLARFFAQELTGGKQ